MIRLSISSSTILPTGLTSRAVGCRVRPPMTPGYEERPYWWDGVDVPQPAPAPLPATVDVAVVGAGYTGLAAALEIARGGRHVIVLDREDIGAGASSRNGGMAHPGGKREVSEFLAQPSGRRLWD